MGEAEEVNRRKLAEVTNNLEEHNTDTVRIVPLLAVVAGYLVACFLLYLGILQLITQPAAPAGATQPGTTEFGTTSADTTQPLPTSSEKNQLNTTQKKDVVQAVSFIVAGAVAAVGLYFTGKTLQNTLESTRRTLYLTEEGQVTDRFSRAIEHLGSITDINGQNPQLETRLGGIYALERIAWDSKRDQDHWTIMEVLTAYVSQNAPWPPVQPPENADPSRSDIQAILTVLGRRKHQRETEDNKLDLRKTNLRGANLDATTYPTTPLERAQFNEANLEGAFLNNANLKGAFFTECSLKGAVLRGAHLEGAQLNDANLERANLDNTRLDQETTLEGAYLRETVLNGAQIRGTDLSKVIGLTPEQVDNADTEDVTMPENKDIVRYLYKQFFRHKRLLLADYIYAATHVLHSALGDFSGSEGVREFVRSFINAFPDLSFSVQEQDYEGDVIVSSFRMSGTHTGEAFQGVDATFSHFEVTGTISTRFEGTEVEEEWFDFDDEIV